MSGFEIWESCGRRVRVAIAVPLVLLCVACGRKSPLERNKDPKPSKKWEEPELHKQDERPQEPWQPIPDEEDDKPGNAKAGDEGKKQPGSAEDG